MHSGEIVSKELISNWENSLKLIENLLVGVDSEDVAKILGYQGNKSTKCVS